MHRMVAAARETRLSERFSRDSSTKRSRAIAAAPRALSLHRQPGRAARGAGAHRRRQASARQPGPGRRGDLLLARHSRQRACDLRTAEQARRARRRSAHRARSSRPRLRPSLPRRAGGDVSLGAAADRRAGAWRAAPHERACALARSLQVPQAVVLENGHMVRLAPGRAEIIDEVPSGRLYLDGRVLVEEDEVSPAPAARSALPASSRSRWCWTARAASPPIRPSSSKAFRKPVHAAIRDADGRLPPQRPRRATRKSSRKASAAPPAAPPTMPGARSR